jgi:hypothetical protein
VAAARSRRDSAGAACFGEAHVAKRREARSARAGAQTGNSCAEAAHESRRGVAAARSRRDSAGAACFGEAHVAKRREAREVRGPEPEHPTHARRTRMKHLVVMAAGTGGHVMPGLAVAAEMQRRGWSVSWLGTPTGMENKLVPKTGIVVDQIAFAGMRGKGLLGNLRGAIRLLGAFPACARLLAKRRADAVLGMGGYVCFPGGWMAWLQRRPLLLVNADAALLLSNKALELPARKIAFGFPGAAAEAMGRRRSSPAIRSAPRSRRCLRRPSGSPGATGRCVCSSSAAASARASSTTACRRRSPCSPRASGPR